MFACPSAASLFRTPRRSSLRAASVVAGLALSGLACWMPIASAQAASASCLNYSTSEPFLSLKDTNTYALVPGGNFEGSTSGWIVSGNVQRVAGGYAVAGSSLGAWSLKLSSNSWAQSPFVCNESGERTFRFFARSEGTSATLLAQAFFETAKGPVATKGATLTLKSGWEASPIIAMSPPPGTTATNGVVQVALRFTALSGIARIDDVFIDPRMRH